MSSYFDTYCIECDDSVRALSRVQLGSLFVRGELVSFEEVFLECPHCEALISDARVEGVNLDRAYDVYRYNNGIMSPSEIKSLRGSYGLSLREFSRFLGFGEQTVSRYERGDLPDRAHGNTLVHACSVEGARVLLSQNRSKLSAKSIEKIEYYIESMTEGRAEKRSFFGLFEDREALAPSAFNGFRKFDLVRAEALVFELAVRCRDLYWTKLQKAVFFADAVSYERTARSFTGLTYAHAPYGPVIDRREDLRSLLVERGAISLKEDGWGEVVEPLKPGCYSCSNEELELISEVAAFVNTFAKATELSEFSHKLSCWASSTDGELISYANDAWEIDKALSERMKSLRS